MTGVRFRVFLTAVLLAAAGSAFASEAVENPYRSGERGQVPIQRLEPLRDLQEGAVFLLKRYATLEALITAQESGRSDNDAFWIGAASLVPGAGQMINQDYLQGGLLLFSSGLAWSSFQELDFTRPKMRYPDAAPYYYAALALRDGIMTYATLHAANSRYRQTRDRTSAMWTGTASLIPGVGQAINGQYWEAAAMFAAWAGAAYLTASLEEVVYGGPGEPASLVRDSEPSLTVAWLPAGAALQFTASW